MPVSDVDHLWKLADEILDAAVASYADQGLDAPPKRFVAHGHVSDDVWAKSCEQMAVFLNRIFAGLPGNEIVEPEHCGHPRTAEFFLRVTRCVHGVDDRGKAPSAEEISGDAEVLLRDAWILLENLLERRSTGQFLDRCQNLALAGPQSFGPQGGVAGWTIVLQIQVHGA